MKNSPFILLLLSFTISVSAQSKRRVFNGKIVSDSLSVDKIHIINKNTLKGTYTNTYGDFAIPAKIDDTIVFSAVQFEPYKRIISEADFQQLQLIIKLKPKINQLDEVIVKSISITKGLSLPNADKKPLDRVENRLNAHNKSSAPIVALATILNQRGGIDNLYYLLSGKRKRDRKLNKLMLKDTIANEKTKTIQEIRLHFKDDFFISIIGIPKQKIDDFIYYCLKDDIIKLYNENRFLELTEIFFKESTPYLELIKN